MDKQIDEIMDWFDFKRVADAMDALDWHWCGYKGVPCESEVREKARTMLQETVRVRQGYSTGGFETTFDTEMDLLGLRFTVARWEALDD